MGGNSTKATSGINGAGTQPQQDAGIQDSAKIFFEDTKKSVRFYLFILRGYAYMHKYRLANSHATTSSVSSPAVQAMP